MVDKLPISQITIFTLPLTEQETVPDTPDENITILYRYAGNVYAKDDTDTVYQLDQPGSTAASYARIADQKAQHDDGGSITSGAWRTRTLNTTETDDDSITSLSSNQITLQAGEYRIHAIAPGFGVGLHNLRFQNVTDATTAVYGISSYCNAQNVNFAHLYGEFTLAGQKTFELQHRVSVSQSGDGAGVGAGFADVERFAVVELWKVS